MVVLVAELAVDVDGALFGQHGHQLFLAQGAQGAEGAVGGAAALEMQLPGLEQAHRVLVVEAVQQFVERQAGQFCGAEGVCQGGYMLPLACAAFRIGVGAGG